MLGGCNPLFPFKCFGSGGRRGGGAPSVPVVPGCVVPQIFSECFQGLVGPAPQGVWSLISGGPGDTLVFSNKAILHANFSDLVQASGTTGKNVPRSNLTLQFRSKVLTLAQNPIVLARAFDPSGNEAFIFNVRASGGTVTVFSGLVAGFMILYSGVSPVNFYSERQVHLTLDAGAIPLLWIDGTSVALAVSGSGSASLGVSNSVNLASGVAVFTNDVEFYDVFVDNVERPPSTVFCCP